MATSHPVRGHLAQKYCGDVSKFIHIMTAFAARYAVKWYANPICALLFIIE
jgi:hypothetical protein